MNLLRYDASGKYQDLGLLILRLVFGLSMFFGHGLGKWGRLLGEEEIQFADPFGLGPTASLVLVVFAEGFCSLLIALGFKTRLAAIPLIITMATAFFAVHLSQEFGRQEKAILFGFTFIALFFTGPGRYSLDHYLGKGKK